MGNHRYPKTRRKRSTEYAKSTKLIKLLGKETLEEIFSRKGMYLASTEISELTGIFFSAYVVHHVRKKIGGTNENA